MFGLSRRGWLDAGLSPSEVLIYQIHGPCVALVELP